MNPLDTIKSFIGGGGTPEQFITKAMLGRINNPIIANLIQSLQNGDNQAVEQFARNVCRERGRNFDKEFPDFMNNMKR